MEHISDFGGKKKSSSHKKLRQKSRNMSSLGLEGDSIIYSGGGPKNESSGKRQPKGRPPSRKNNNEGNFDLASFLDEKRKK